MSSLNKTKILLKKLENYPDGDVASLAQLLATRGADCELIRAAAMDCMVQYAGDAVYFRGLVEVTNRCRHNCYYCGIRRDAPIERYRATEANIMAAAHTCNRLGFGSMVLQSGELNTGAYVDFICRVVSRIKKETISDMMPDGLGITLSIGVLSLNQYQRLFDAGAHRYLLRLETSNPGLFEAIHPPEQSLDQRLEAIAHLKAVGYQVGTGVMIGLPGQTNRMLAEDVLMFRRLDVDMVGMGPFLPAADTPMAAVPISSVQERLQLGLNMIAVTRLVCRDINIASTTALEGLHPRGRLKGLQYGANVAMPNLTPLNLRKHYKLYDDKPVAQSVDDAVAAIESIGRKVALNQYGDSRHFFSGRRNNPAAS